MNYIDDRIEKFERYFEITRYVNNKLIYKFKLKTDDFWYKFEIERTLDIDRMIDKLEEIIFNNRQSKLNDLDI